QSLWNAGSPLSRGRTERGHHHCASHIRPLVVEIGAALLRFEIAFDIAERVHDAAQPLPDQLIELDRLREREIAAHLHGDLVMLEWREVARREIARECDRVRLELCGGHCLAD